MNGRSDNLLRPPGDKKKVSRESVMDVPCRCVPLSGVWRCALEVCLRWEVSETA